MRSSHCRQADSHPASHRSKASTSPGLVFCLERLDIGGHGFPDVQSPIRAHRWQRTDHTAEFGGRVHRLTAEALQQIGELGRAIVATCRSCSATVASPSISPSSLGPAGDSGGAIGSTRTSSAPDTEVTASCGSWNHPSHRVTVVNRAARTLHVLDWAMYHGDTQALSGRRKGGRNEYLLKPGETDTFIVTPSASRSVLNAGCTGGARRTDWRQSPAHVPGYAARVRGHGAVPDLNIVPARLHPRATMAGELCETRLFQSPRERDWALADPSAMFEGKGSLMKFDEGMVRRTELVMVVAVIILVLVAYLISKN